MGGGERQGTVVATRPLPSVTRREQVLTAAARLFAGCGFHRVTMEDIGATADLHGPALYRDFQSTDEVLVALFEAIGRHWDGASAIGLTTHPEAAQVALCGLVRSHVSFAVRERALLTIWAREQDRLPAPDRGRLQRLRDRQADTWARLLMTARAGLAAEEARVVIFGVLALIESSSVYGSPLSEAAAERLLADMAAAVLQRSGPYPDRTEGPLGRSVGSP